jgi:DNA mismatch repair ATPase MutS
VKELKELTSKLKSIKSGSSLIGHGANVSDGPGEMLLDYLRLLTHIDLIQFSLTLSKVQAHTKEIEKMIEINGKLDALISVASFRELIPYYCEPEFTDSASKPSIDTDDLYHPLIKEPVANSFHDNRPVILTGSNASGKSTFLKTLALNVILAQSIHTVTAHSFKSCFFRTYTSMALRDNLEGEESYYMVEIKTLKRIMDASDNKKHVLGFVDEVLRGTNTTERILTK